MEESKRGGRPPKRPEDRAESITVRLNPYDRMHLGVVMDDMGVTVTQAIQMGLALAAERVWENNGELARRKKAAQRAMAKADRGSK